MRVTVFSVYGTHFRQAEAILRQHPNGLHKTLQELFESEGFESVAVYQTEDDDGGMLTDDILNATDVLVWWGHIFHHNVTDALVEKITARVLGGMGCIFLHSSHMAKPFRKLLGTTCTLRWREANERERLWVTAPHHPIAAGLPSFIELDGEEMYGEYFDIPKPDDVVFTGWFQGGEVFRSGVTFTRGRGKIFYFQPGHESNAAYHNENVRKILVNAVRWTAPLDEIKEPEICQMVEPLEKIVRS